MEILIELVNKSNNIVKVTIIDDVINTLSDNSYIINRKMGTDENDTSVYRLQERDYSIIKFGAQVKYEFYEVLPFFGSTYTYNVIRINNTTFDEETSNEVSVASCPAPISNLAIDYANSQYDADFDLPNEICLIWDEYDTQLKCKDVIGFNVYYSLSEHNKFVWSQPQKVRGTSTSNTTDEVMLVPITETKCMIKLPQLTELPTPKDIKLSVVAITADVQSDILEEVHVLTRGFTAGVFKKDNPMILTHGSKEDTDEQLALYGKVLSPAYTVYFNENAYDEDTLVFCEELDVTNEIIGWDEVYTYFINVKNLKDSVEVAIYMPYNDMAKYDVRIKTGDVLTSLPWTYNVNSSTIHFKIKETCTFVVVSKNDLTATTTNNSFSLATRRIIERLPSWSKIKRKPSKSNGAYFLELIGMEFAEFESLMNYVQEQMYIGTASETQIGNVYKYYLPAEVEADDAIFAFRGGIYYMEEAQDLNTFYKSYFEKTDLPEIYYNRLIFIDYKEKVLYLRNIDESISIKIAKENEVEPYFVDENPVFHLHKVWNFFDEIGLLFDLNRYDWEGNVEFKERILDVFKNPSNATRDGLMNGIARELCIRKTITWDDTSQDLIITEPMVIYNKIKVEGVYIDVSRIFFTNEQEVVIKADPSIPNGAEVSFVHSLEMHTLHNEDDDIFTKVLYDADGKGTNALLTYVNKINEVSPMRWDSFHWNIGYWDPIQPESKGKSYISSLCDASCEGFEDK